MINVLHLRDTDRVCGPGKTIIETVCATDSREFTQKVGLFLLPSETGNQYHQAATRRGVEVIPVTSSHPYDPRVVKTLVGIVKAHRIHIVHSHEYKSDLLAYLVSRVYPIPIMTTIHGWITNSLKSRFAVGISRRVLRHFERVVAVSGETKRRVLACGVPEERVVVIHNAIVTENYRPEAHARGYLRARFGLPSDALIVGNIGRLSPEKGQRDFVTAAVPLVREYPNAYFALVGDGAERAALERQAGELGLGDRVLFTGHLQDVRPAYRDIDILALTSHTEGLPNVVLESLCMNTPVLATDVGGTSDIVQDGVTGLLVPHESPRAIAEGLRRLIGDPSLARRLAENGRRLIHERFTFAQRVAKEEALYRDILAASGGQAVDGRSTCSICRQ